MKTECYIVRDLLPSYIDHLCSEETSRFIENHIATCEQCAEHLQQMREEFDVHEEPNVQDRIEQKKPFQKVARYIDVQKSFMTFLRRSLWISIIVTVGFFIHSLTMFIDLHHDRQEAQGIEEQKGNILEDTFAVLETQQEPDETALQTVFQKYNGELQYLAVFSIDDVEDFTLLREGQTEPYPIDYKRLQVGPTTIYPINYAHAALVVGKNGEITESIIPNDYDIGTVAMADDQWIVQYEYQESYLETIEKAHQIKYYGPSTWTVFQLPIVLFIVTVFIFGNWLIQKRNSKPVENILD
jgi:flagellar basal body-associated protein FliL